MKITNHKKINYSPHDILVAIDVGTTKICVLIGHKINDDQCQIIGIGRAPSEGLERGVIVDVVPAIQSIKAAIQEAELMAGITIESAAIGISGSHIHARNSTGMIPIKHGDIRPGDITRVIAAAQAIPLPEGEKILHVIPQLFTIDSNQTVRDPIGMHGVRLEAHVHIITGGVTSVQNLVRCCEAAGIKVQDVVLEPIASAEAVLSKDERELGVGMLDIGGGTADFAVYQKGAIRHTHIFPIAGNLFTNDIALCLRTTRSEAERIKKEYASVISDPELLEYPVTVKTVDGEQEKTVRLQELSAVVSARSEELFLLLHHEIEKFKLTQSMPAGLVITGGGALLNGLHLQAEKILDIPTRIGKTKADVTFQEELSNPSYATGYGLLLYMLKKQKNDKSSELSGPMMQRIFWKMKSWIADFF
jgi:cell division protein FtsA